MGFPSRSLAAEEETPDDSRSRLGFLGREEGGAGGWRHGTRPRVARVAGKPRATEHIERNASGSPTRA
jgi:hypothetical protein